jgi:hypothetical protein
MSEHNRLRHPADRAPVSPPPPRRADRRLDTDKPIPDAAAIPPDQLPATADEKKTIFAEAYCARRGIALSQYREAALRECLYWPARILYPLLRRYDRDLFAPDFDLIRRVGWVSQREDLRREMEDFFLHPHNGQWLRRRCKCRISCRRLMGLIWETMPALAPQDPSRSHLPPSPF